MSGSWVWVGCCGWDGRDGWVGGWRGGSIWLNNDLRHAFFTILTIVARVFILLLCKCGLFCAHM